MENKDIVVSENVVKHFVGLLALMVAALFGVVTINLASIYALIGSNLLNP